MQNQKQKKKNEQKWGACANADVACTEKHRIAISAFLLNNQVIAYHFRDLSLGKQVVYKNLDK